MLMALELSHLSFDNNGNKALDKKNQKSRVDCLQSAVIACGMGIRYLRQPKVEYEAFAL